MFEVLIEKQTANNLKRYIPFQSDSNTVNLVITGRQDCFVKLEKILSLVFYLEKQESRLLVFLEQQYVLILNMPCNINN